MKSPAFTDEMTTKEDEETFNLKDWLSRMFRLWPWFLLSLLVCLSLAYLYLYKTDPVYKALASIMVNDEKKGGVLIDDSKLKEIGLAGHSKLMENEMEILKSYDLMQDVVDSLQLFVSIKKVTGSKDIEVFDSNIPFTIEIVNPGVIKTEKHWTIIDTANSFLFQGEYEKQPHFLQYGQVYNSGDIKFRVRQSSVNNVSNQFSTYKIEINPRNETADLYSKKLSVKAANKVGTVINLEIKDINKEKAIAILETLITIYNQQGLEGKNRITDNTIDFLNDRLINISRELQGVEGTVEKFKSENKVTDLSSDAQQYLTLSQRVDIQKAESQTQLNIINALQKDLELNQDNPQLVPSTLGINEPSLGQLIESHNSLVLKKERMLQKAGPKNPLLIDLQDQIKELRSRLLTNVNNLKRAYIISRDDISRQDAQLNTRIRGVPLLEKKLVQITRNQNVQEQLYAFLLQKREEAAASRASNIDDSRIILKARNLDAVWPKPRVVWALGVMLGLLLPIGFVSIRNFLNNKIGDTSQVERFTNIPVLGIISHVKKSGLPLAINSSSTSAVAEHIRKIRTSISFSGKLKGVKCILITSFQPGDGKSFVSLNLAASYALLNKRTVIVEFDLRKPSIAKSLDIDATAGISTILSGESSINDLIIEVPGYDGHLFLLPAGAPSSNSAELISGSSMNCLVKSLQDRFDYIIIDSPASGLVADAELLQKYADITLIVLRQNHTSIEVFKRLKHIGRHTADKPTYLLLNDVAKKRYQRDYGYGG